METLRRRYPCFSRLWIKEEKPWDRNPRRRPSYIPELNISGILQIARIFKSLDKFLIIADSTHRRIVGILSRKIEKKTAVR